MVVKVLLRRLNLQTPSCRLWATRFPGGLVLFMNFQFSIIYWFFYNFIYIIFTTKIQIASWQWKELPMNLIYSFAAIVIACILLYRFYLRPRRLKSYFEEFKVLKKEYVHEGPPDLYCRFKITRSGMNSDQDTPVELAFSKLGGYYFFGEVVLKNGEAIVQVYFAQKGSVLVFTRKDGKPFGGKVELLTSDSKAIPDAIFRRYWWFKFF